MAFEKRKATAQREAVLHNLQIAGEYGVKNNFLKKISGNYTSRIAELRCRGYNISCKEIGDGVYTYILNFEPEKPKKQKRAIRLFWQMVDESGGSVTKEQLKEFMKNNRMNVVRNWGANSSNYVYRV